MSTPLLALASPGWLWLLAPVAALAVLYLVQHARRSRYAVRFATLPMLERLVPRRPAWRRHLPAVLLLLAFATLAVAASRPEVDEQVPRERATVIVTVDVSLSMMATDVEPDRLTAARDAAKSFVDGLPDGFNVGVVEFAGSAAVLAEPSTDHDDAVAALDRLELAEGTAIDEGLLTSLAQIEAVAADSPTESGEPVPAHIVLLSDGTELTEARLMSASAAARADNVAVSTIAFGTSLGTVTIEDRVVPVPVDPESLDFLADSTGGTANEAASASELERVYDDIQTAIGYQTKHRDVTPHVLTIGLLLSLTAAGLSLRWFARII